MQDKICTFAVNYLKRQGTAVSKVIQIKTNHTKLFVGYNSIYMI